MLSVSKLMSIGISLTILVIVIINVLVPIVKDIDIPAAITGGETIKVIVQLFPLFLGIGGLFALARMFLGKE